MFKVGGVALLVLDPAAETARSDGGQKINVEIDVHTAREQCVITDGMIYLIFGLSSGLWAKLLRSIQNGKMIEVFMHR